MEQGKVTTSLEMQTHRAAMRLLTQLNISADVITLKYVNSCVFSLVIKFNLKEFHQKTCQHLHFPENSILTVMTCSKCLTHVILYLSMPQSTGLCCSFPCSPLLSTGLACATGLKNTQAPLISTQCGMSPFDFLF